MSELSRRDFLKGAVAASAATVATGALGTAAFADEVEAPAKAGRWSWDTPPAPIPDDQISQVYDCDVCIVGAGVAGIAASVYAAKHGLNVVVLQKEDTTWVNGQSIGAWNCQYGTDQGIEWDTNLTVQLYADASDGKANLKLVRNFIEHSGEAMEYVTSLVHEPPANFSLTTAGVKGKEHVSCNFLIGGDFVTRYEGWRIFNQNLADVAIAEGATYLYSTPGKQLVTDESGAVTGVIGQNEAGEYVKVNAAMGVILATGDVGCDDELKEAYFPILVGRPDLHTRPCNTGDGLKMGLWVGAAMDYAPAGMQLHFDPSPLSFPAPPYSAAPWLHVNIRGERFTNENQGYQALATAITCQPEFRAYQIFDCHYPDNLDKYHNGYRGGSQAVFDQCLEMGSILKADTIEELAELAELPVDTFVATVARYNELAEKGADDDFGSQIIQYNAIKEPPFYAVQRMPAILVAGLGLTCNEYGQVMNKDHYPIPGLYAAGNNMGSYYGYDYPVEGFGGTTIGHSITLAMLDVMHMMGTHGQKIE